MAANAKRTGRTGPDMRGFPASPDTILNQEHIGMMVRGSVDVVTGTEVRGWAFAPGRREAVMVQAVLNHEILGEALADMHRPDLAAAGLGDGNSGFEIRLFRPIDPLYVPFLSVKVDGGDAELPRAPMLGFGEFFASLYASHPATGRHRSVYGGLWTDRTDAAALLRGKMAIGQISAEATSPITQLIHEGLTVIKLEEAPSERHWTEALAEGVAEVLTDVGLLTVLRAALEDNPVVIKAGWAYESEGEFIQSSADNPSPSLAECLRVIVPFGEGVMLDMVRESHRLPEFTPHGTSRWANHSRHESLGVASANGMLDQHMLVAGTAAVVGPGSVFRLCCQPGGKAVWSLCLPSRGLPMNFATELNGRKNVTNAGMRVWV